MTPATLSVDQIATGYGELQVLWDITLAVEPGEAVILLGANGAGKTTLLKTLAGLIPTWRGTIRLGSDDLTHVPTNRRIRQGLGFVTETGIIMNLTVEENLRVGGYHLSRPVLHQRMAELLEEFPDLRTKRKELAGSLSGGQRKMLAVAKALMGRPQILLMDEPSAGLSPLFVKEVIALLKAHRGPDLGLLIAEQNVKFLELATRVFVLDGGRIRFNGTVAELEHNDAIRQAYFGLTGPEF
ncbi:ABC transporter related protein [Sulfobacillus acidophilus TPY]|uniref:Amino acid/amide ABC transporter ATP-binding protein 2, HAAT family n=1 Tax=Sulfobacillus acidophilus (strain ATCC 700253 / DSM 10332 / NAL) TaxID=679936 RepID=G8TSG7_SULAD|nr:ABC transporter related protein [Sulfobacillus acidophilus TPY]AEW06659.1 amino acid/amide ABC transporter ATP-binding protein 2, HAAT family [Sulfobacillus acidophilus DSM 10332]